MMVIAGDVLNISRDLEVIEYDDTDNDYVPYDQRPETYIVPAVFSIILIVGVTGNGILVLILLCHANMRNVPNIYVLSLALGDLLLIVTCVPFTSMLYTIESWPWGLPICKLSECAKDISIGVSVFTLAALAAERYCAIVNPIRRHVAGLSAKPLTILTASLIWVLAIILAMPAAIFSNVPTIKLQENRTILICSPFPEEYGEKYKKSMVMFKFLAYYAIPLCVIAGFYMGMSRHLILSTRNMPGEIPGCDHRYEQIRARRRVGKMVLSFIIVFVICFLPYHVFMLWFHFWPSSKDDYNDFWHVFRMVGFCLSFSNSCVNPIALYFISGTFRQRFIARKMHANSSQIFPPRGNRSVDMKPFRKHEILPDTIIFNKYLCCCLPGGYAVCSGSRIERGRNRGDGGSGFQRNRGGIRGTFYDTSFGSTFRRHTQEFNSTGVYEMASIEKNCDRRLLSLQCKCSRDTIIAENDRLKRTRLHQNGCVYQGNA